MAAVPGGPPPRPGQQQGPLGSVGFGGGSGSSQPNEPQGPIAQDDDIVAQQLREAAENETDPELKKRLWEEYRRYKQS